MFDSFPKSEFEIVSHEGESRGTTNAIATGSKIIIPDQNIVIEVGDEMRRRLPNGRDETFEVIDPVFMQEMIGVQGHYQVKVRKKGLFPHGSGGNYTVNVSGPNSRVNIGSHDQSTNIVVDKSVISDVREAVQSKVEDADARKRLIAALDSMEAAKDETELGVAYQSFISSAANHMTVIAPFLPALGQMFGG